MNKVVYILSNCNFFERISNCNFEIFFLLMCHIHLGKFSANVSVNRPLRPAQKKPAEGAVSDERPPAFTDPAPRVRKDPSFSRKPSEKRGSRRFEQDQGNQTVAAQPTARPMDSKTSSSYSAAGRESGGAATTSGGGVAFSSENEAMADAWEKEKLAKIKKQ